MPVSGCHPIDCLGEGRGAVLVFREVIIGEGGIAGCVRCAGRVSVAPRLAEEVGEDLRRAASELDRPGPNVVFAGFEPFAHPELPTLVRLAVDAGYERIRLRTDAGALSSPGNAEGVLGAGVRQIEVVLLGAGDEHDSLTGRSGLFAAAMQGVSRFAAVADASGLDVGITGLVPVCRHNVQHVPEAVAALASLGAVAVTIDARRRALDADVVRSALDTGTTGLVAVTVLGQEVEAPYDRLPSAVEEASR